METNCLIGWQPILNCNEGIVACELLFRSAGWRDDHEFYPDYEEQP